MESLEQHNRPKERNIKVFAAAIIAAFLLVAGAVALWSLMPSQAIIEQTALEGVHREGSPEFEALTKRIVIQTDQNRTTESPTAFGSIMMAIPAKITNRTDTTLTALEVKVGVVDTKGQVIKEKAILVVPKQKETLAPGESMMVTGVVEGFDAADDRANVQWKVTGIKAE